MTDDVKGLAAVADKLMGNSRGSIAWAGEPDGSLQNTFGDVKIRASESETFYGEPDPWVGRAADGTIFWTISNGRLTKVRASLMGGGYRCWWNFAGHLRTTAWHTDFKENQPFRIEVQLHDAQEGVLLRTFVERHMLCREEGTIFFSFDFNPDIYEVFKGFAFIPLTTYYYAC